jgi:hypothetical protein
VGGIKPVKPVGADLVEKVEAYVDGLGRRNGGQRDGILRKLREMPSCYRKAYVRAIAGQSRPQAVKLNCLECVGWKKADVVTCETMACVFWPYRPYVKKGEAKRRILNAGC